MGDLWRGGSRDGCGDRGCRSDSPKRALSLLSFSFSDVYILSYFARFYSSQPSSSLRPPSVFSLSLNIFFLKEVKADQPFRSFNKAEKIKQTFLSVKTKTLSFP